MGLDCQWRAATTGPTRRRVALLQICSYEGKIALIPLHKVSRIPQDLLDILSDRNIIKAGIETLKDAEYLLNDYGLAVNGT